MEHTFIMINSQMRLKVTSLYYIRQVCQLKVGENPCKVPAKYIICFDSEGQEKFGQVGIHTCYYHYMAIRLARPNDIQGLYNESAYNLPRAFRNYPIDVLETFAMERRDISPFFVCSLMDYSGPCTKLIGDGYFGKKNQFEVHNRKLHLTINPESHHIFICNYHENMIIKVPQKIKYLVCSDEEGKAMDAYAAKKNKDFLMAVQWSNKCCLIDFNGKCGRPTGQAYFGGKFQLYVSTFNLQMIKDSTAKHIFICQYHENTIRVAQYTHDLETYLNTKILK